MYKNIFVFSIVLLVLFASLNTVRADRRSYAWNYEYQVMEKGQSEIENYLTLSSPTRNMKGNTTTTLQIEFETGMTNHFDFAVYQVLSQAPGESLTYEGYKLRARYKFGEKGDFFIDPLIYAEYAGKPDFSEHELELKLILSKDVGRFNFVLNPVLELEKADADWGSVFGYSAGVKYAVSDLFSAGIEALGDDHGNYFGPTISHGNYKAWVSLGALFNVGKVLNNGPEIQLRLLSGFAL